MTSTLKEFAHLQIPLQKILDATDNFSDKSIIGRGGFGNVYRGKLEHDGKTIRIAARRLDRKYGQGDVEFWNEVSMLSRLRGMLAVTYMVGFCDEKGEKIIINQHYPKGSLSMYISDMTLTWIQRFSIAQRLCQIIEEIHDGHSDYIIHRNINSSTILLDVEWSPILSGFEFSITHSIEQKNRLVFSEVIGTRGYVDPAIEKYGGVNNKSDVYSLGVVLFELLCGRKAFEENRFLAPLAKFHYENRTLKDIIHPDLWNQMNPQTFKSFSKLAYSCLEDKPELRPNAKQLAVELEMVMVEIPWNKPVVQMAEGEEGEEDEMDGVQFLKDMFETCEEGEEDEMDGVQFLKDTFETCDIVKMAEGEEDEKDGVQFLKDVCDTCDIVKVEHLKIGLKADSPILSTTTSCVKYQDGYLINRELGCRYREDDFLLRNKNVLPKRDYTMMYIYFDSQGGVDHKCLNKYLDSNNLTWGKRLKICIDVAHRIDYLHDDEMQNQNMVIHGHINSYNVKLDDKSGAKVVGYNKVAILRSNQDDDSLQLTEIPWKKYYMDPEYAETSKLKRESDVYYFGIVMFEILCGIPGDSLYLNEFLKDEVLTPLARRWFDEGTIKEMLSPIIKEENYGNNSFLKKGPNEDSLDTFINITYQCLAETRNERPNMKVVLKELQKALSEHENHKDPLRMSFSDINLATQNFDRANCIGGGGFGLVYKGKLAYGKVNGHTTIVAKKLDKSQGQGEKQYYNELRILYEYNHENVIGLIGYSNETDEKLIVYEYASKGSLDKHLNNASLTWRNRLKICIDVAAGLNFLHEGIQGQGVVIHRDIKTANILLFDDWKAKVGDFGLSLISVINEKTNFTIDHPCGTKDYVDPMYLKSGLLTVESDVYSLGVALFEILCGRAIYTIPKHKSQSLLNFIKHKFEDGIQDEVVFKAIKEEIVPKSLTTFLNIVYKCLENDREKRPTTKEVLAQLEKALKFQDDKI